MKPNLNTALPNAAPIPGDNVIGYRNQDGSIIIHKAKCPNAIKLMSSQGNRIIPAKWTTHKILSYLVKHPYPGSR